MLSLADRHIDRAQRKVDNKLDSVGSSAGGNAGSVSNALIAAQEGFNALSDDDKNMVMAGLKSHSAFSGVDAYSGAFDNQGNLKTAGIGVPNPLIAPAGVLLRTESGLGDNADGGVAAGVAAKGWGEPPKPSSAATDHTNMNGAAVASQTSGEGQSGQSGTDASGEGAGAGGWGSGGGSGKLLAPINVGMKVADLEAVALKESVDLTGAANNEERVKRINEKRAA